jgi:transposase InsO family protein
MNADNLLWRVSADFVPKLWLPKALHATVLKACHSHPLSAHFGFFKTLHKIQEKFTWLGMREDISRFVRSCQTCQRTKPSNRKPTGFMETSPAVYPMSEISVDLVGPLPRSTQGYLYILVIVDKFSRFPELFPIRKPTSRAVVDKLEEFMCRHGFPQSVSSDNGQQFVSKLWKGVMKQLNIKDRHTVPYRPCGQQVERHNGILKTALKAYCTSHRTWDQHLPAIAFAMRTAVSEVTGYSPAYLAYGRNLQPPWDTQSPPDAANPLPTDAHEYATTLASRLDTAIEWAAKNISKATNRQKAHYDRSRREHDFKVGDLVLRDNHPKSSAVGNFTTSLAHRRNGPYRIIHKLGANTFQLWDDAISKGAGKANSDQLQLWVKPMSGPTSDSSQPDLTKNRQVHQSSPVRLPHGSSVMTTLSPTVPLIPALPRVIPGCPPTQGLPPAFPRGTSRLRGGECHRIPACGIYQP